MPDNSTGGAVNPFDQNEEKSSEQSKERSALDAKEQAADKWKQIHKGSAKDSREELRPSSVPVNPFAPAGADLNIRDRNYEENLKEDVDENTDFSDDEEDFEEDDIKEEVDAAPVNPFEHNPFAEKPLEEVKNVEEPKAKVKEEESAEEMEHAKEVNANANEDAEEFSSSEKEDVIDVPAEDAEIVNSPDLADAQGAFDSDVQEFKEDFWEILRHAGIDKSVLKWVVIALVLGILLLIFFVFGLSSLFSKESPSTNEREEAPVERERDQEPQQDPGEVEVDLDALQNSLNFGLEYSPLEPQPIGRYGGLEGIETAMIIGGGDALNKEDYVAHFELLRKMENAFRTDVYALLNQSTDRQATFDAHVAELADLIAQGEAAVASLDQEMDYLSAEYEVAVLERDALEEQFFANVDILHGEAAQSSMQSFIEYSKQATELKAEFNARSVVRDFFVNDLSYLRPRYNDIVSNEAALLEGVRVFDVPGSDIDAIQPLEIEN